MNVYSPEKNLLQELLKTTDELETMNGLEAMLESCEDIMRTEMKAITILAAKNDWDIAGRMFLLSVSQEIIIAGLKLALKENAVETDDDADLYSSKLATNVHRRYQKIFAACDKAIAEGKLDEYLTE